MRAVYVQPQVDLVSFASSKAIATEQPGWGWEEDVFSTSEPRNIDEKAEGGDSYEG